MSNNSQKTSAVNTSANTYPQYPTAKVGKERKADVDRTAAELSRIHDARAKYISDKIGKGAEYFIQVLVRANASDLSDGAIRELLTILTYADRDGTNAFPCHQTIADITGCGVSTSKRRVGELTEAGWIDTEHLYEKRRDIAIREVLIPDANLEEFPATAAAKIIGGMIDQAKAAQKSKASQIRDSRRLKSEPVPTTADRSVNSSRGAFLDRGPNVVDFASARQGGKAVRS